ncbi:MAG: hypothetical protein H6627_08625 [Calditrichae bacterium]|nr:hypothetical protein [Calditrichota bacterium]MCB9058616.1 hypothetical protein [Calditrichia bacterium]
MKKYIQALLMLIIIMFAINMLAVNDASALPKNEVDIVIKKIDGKWKVFDATDSTITHVKAKKGQKITWTAEGTDVYFQFMDEKLVGKFKHALKDGKKISLNIGPNAKVGENSYAVFCTADMEFAEGNSPPIIIVENN